jgi:endonuclease/exonuclease/phosphatase family metal-dependent hydrolase
MVVVNPRINRLALTLLVALGMLAACDRSQTRCSGGDAGQATGIDTDSAEPGFGDSAGDDVESVGTTTDADTSTGDDGGESSTTTGEPSAEVLRVMTYNIRHGAESSLEALAEVIRAEDPHIVALQEVDKEAVRSDGIFQSYRLGQLTGMSSLFRAALDFPTGGQYGLAILSRYPIISSEKVLLTSGSEQRILVVVDVEIEAGWQVPIAITHMGLDAEERLEQAQEIITALDGRQWTILMGDVNAEPHELAAELLAAAFVDVWPEVGIGPGNTIPVTNPTRRIDYIFLGAAWGQPIEAHVPMTAASDHLPIVATLPRP